GECAFPGGGLDPDEAPVDAALRECREETGLVVPQRCVLGTLPALHVRVSGNVVTPVLAWSPREVREHRPAAARDLEADAVGWISRRRLVDPEHRVTVCDGAGGTGPGFRTCAGGSGGLTGKRLRRMLTEAVWVRPWTASARRALGGAGAERAGGPGTPAGVVTGQPGVGGVRRIGRLCGDAHEQLHHLGSGRVPRAERDQRVEGVPAQRHVPVPEEEEVVL